MAKKETVDHPAHYTFGKFEVLDVIEDWGFDKNYYLACVIKYVARADHKGRPIEDLEKVRWYLDREIAKSNRLRSPTRDRYKELQHAAWDAAAAAAEDARDDAATRNAAKNSH